MSSGDQTVEVTLRLSKDRYEQIQQAARVEHRPVEDLLDSLIVEGLDSRASTREILEQVSQDYRARLAREGKLSRSVDAVRQELSDLREQIARDLCLLAGVTEDKLHGEIDTGTTMGKEAWGEVGQTGPKLD